MKKNLGLLAGAGELPIVIAESAKAKGYDVFAIGLEPVEINSSLENHVYGLEKINVGKIGKIISTLKKQNVTDVVLAGKVNKTLMFTGKVKPDLKAVSMLLKLKDKRDDTILQEFINSIEKEGINVCEVTEFASHILAPQGTITTHKPTKDEMKDIEFGLKMAKEMGRLDIGQTVVIKDQAVMAVEAIEGTDLAIKRGGELAGENAVVVKVSKPDQDKRFDFPTVGAETLDAMIKVKARVLAVEADKTLLVQKSALLDDANSHKITIYGV